VAHRGVQPAASGPRGSVPVNARHGNWYWEVGLCPLIALFTSYMPHCQSRLQRLRAGPRARAATVRECPWAWPAHPKLMKTRWSGLVKSITWAASSTERRPLPILPLLLAALCLVAGSAAGQGQAPEAAATQPPVGEWQSLFDGKSLAGWKETPFSGHGPVRIENEAIILGAGVMTGVTWTKWFPTSNYEIRLDAARLEGRDFFAGITFPVFDSFCSWINGGWNGGVVGLSSLDGYDASENEASFFRQFERGRWYKLRLQVTGRYIAAWIDEEQVIYVDLGTRAIGLREGEIELFKPLGIASYATPAGLRKREYRLLDQQSPPRRPRLIAGRIAS